MNHLPKSLKEKKRKEKERHHEPTVEIPDRTRIYTGAIENDPHKSESSVKDHKQLEIYAEFTK